MRDFSSGVPCSATTQSHSVQESIIICSSVLGKAAVLSTVHEAVLLLQRIDFFFIYCSKCCRRSNVS